MFSALDPGHSVQSGSAPDPSCRGMQPGSHQELSVYFSERRTFSSLWGTWGRCCLLSSRAALGVLAAVLLQPWICFSREGNVNSPTCRVDTESRQGSEYQHCISQAAAWEGWKGMWRKPSPSGSYPGPVFFGGCCPHHQASGDEEMENRHCALGCEHGREVQSSEPAPCPGPLRKS